MGEINLCIYSVNAVGRGTCTDVISDNARPFQFGAGSRDPAYKETRCMPLSERYHLDY